MTEPSPAQPASDVFISYAHLDNQPLSGTREGWISRFHGDLAIKLSELLGEKVNIWRDAKLTGNDFFGEAIVNQFPSVKALVSVVSPRYLKSEWCVREVEEFSKAAGRTGGLRVQDKSRLVKVVKTPVAASDVPAQLLTLFSSILGFDFFEIDPASGRPREFSEEFGQEAKRHYFERMYDVAYDLCQLLRFLKANPQGGPMPPAVKSGKTVYLALTSSDRQPHREQVRRELIERGHAVLPDAPMPMGAGEFEPAVRACLEQCDLSVHLVGDRYGIIPEEATASVVELQHQVAAATPGRPGFSRIIWVPKEGQVHDERQGAFLKRLHEEAAAQRGVDLIQDSIEKLKELILDRLTPPPPPAPAPAPSADQPPRVYLICDQQDELSVDPIEDHLLDQGLDVSRTHFDGDEAAISLAHRQALQLCDAALIYYGAASRAWVEVKLMDVLQAPGYGRTKPLLAEAVCIALPENREKQRFRHRTAEIIRLPEPFSPSGLQPFLDRLKAAARAP